METLSANRNTPAYGPTSVEEALALLRSQAPWPKVQAALATAQQCLSSPEGSLWQRALVYYTHMTEAWIPTVTDAATCNAFYLLLPILEQALYFEIFGCPPQAFVARSDAAIEFQRALCRRDARVRARVARRAFRSTRATMRHDAREPSAQCAGDQIADTLGPEQLATPTREDDDDPSALAAEREQRLQRFLHSHPGVTLASIKRGASVFTSDFQKWRQGICKDTSVMSLRIEDVLAGATPVEMRKRVSGQL